MKFHSIVSNDFNDICKTSLNFDLFIRRLQVAMLIIDILAYIISMISNPFTRIRWTLWGDFSSSRILWRFINKSSLSCQWTLNQYIPKEKHTKLFSLWQRTDCVDPKTLSHRDHGISCCIVSVKASYVHLWSWCHRFMCICDLTWYIDLQCVLKHVMNSVLVEEPMRFEFSTLVGLFWFQFC